MGPGDIAPVRRTSIRLVPPNHDDEDEVEEPTKTDGDYDDEPNISSQSRRRNPSFQFDFAPSSPAVGESALSPPQTSQSTFARQNHARASSSAVPWQQLGGGSLSYNARREVVTNVEELSPPHIEESRFSQNTSSSSDSCLSPTSPSAHRSRFSPTTIAEDSEEGHTSPEFDSSPPPIQLRSDGTVPPRSPASPSAWRSFFTGPVSPQNSDVVMAPEHLSSTPSPPGSSGSSSSSFDGTSSSPMMALPALGAFGPSARQQSVSSLRYSYAYPTQLEVIEEDEVYPASPQRSPPIPQRSPDRPQTQFSETEASDPPSSPRDFADTPVGALAALSAAAGTRSPAAHQSVHFHPPSPVAFPQSTQRWSRAPQIPPLPSFDHNTASLQRLFSYYPAPRLATETPHLSQQPFPYANMPLSAASSILTYGSVRGPRGERFSALREKRQTQGIYRADGKMKQPRSWCGIKGMSWKLWAVVLLLLVLMFGIIAIGVGVGLGQANSNDENATFQNNGAGNANPETPSGANQSVFPAGTYSIMTNLRNITTSCSNISATWNCAPGAAQNSWDPTANSSAVTVFWKIDQNNSTSGVDDDGFSISSGGNPFALKFPQTPLTLREAGGANEHWGFETRVRKKVRPAVDVSGRSVGVECKYDSVQLSARLFTRRDPADGSGRGPNAWPGAVEVEERSETEGSCAEIRNGVLGQRVAVGEGPAECLCGYSNSDPDGD